MGLCACLAVRSGRATWRTCRAQRSWPTTMPCLRNRISRDCSLLVEGAKGLIPRKLANLAWGKSRGCLEFLARCESSDGLWLMNRFTSVYHMTDCPTVLSGEYLLYLDPQRQYVPGLTASHDPGTRCSCDPDSRCSYGLLAVSRYSIAVVRVCVCADQPQAFCASQPPRTLRPCTTSFRPCSCRSYRCSPRTRRQLPALRRQPDGAMPMEH